MRHPIAHFIRNPRTIEDLQKPHDLTQCKPYTIDRSVALAKIDYENFITDFCVDRWFIEDNTSLMHIANDGIWNCIFVHQQLRSDGILVMSDGCDFPLYTAYILHK